MSVAKVPGASDCWGTIPQAVAEIAAGRMVIVVDGPDRENEGDLVMAAQHVTPEAINFMAVHGRGLVCAPMRRSRLDELQIGPMTKVNTDVRGTAFHVGIDHRWDATTGISAADRAAAIRALADPASTAADFTQPGHVFPLAYTEGGVLTRAGHTEASVDLAIEAGLEPAAVICEIADRDGSMARVPALMALAERHGLCCVSIEDLIAYRTSRELERVVETRLPVGRAEFRAIGYRAQDGEEHIALVLGDVSGEPALVRLHSECLSGDVFGSRRCDCGPQLEQAISTIIAAGRGAIVYLRGHEGRGIGLIEKLRAYALQDQGLDTFDANVELGHEADAREYSVGARMLADLGIQRALLLSNNPAKRRGLEQNGIEVVDNVPLLIAPNADNLHYLRTKQMRMGHRLGLAGAGVDEADAGAAS
jgi:3,4-dihydroxy 2-butanone 4-phosphate synthase/GTP cyclohydrolase II